jgi:hypothetical protein
VRDVAAPLYRFFLADAQTAARAGETERVLECVGLALDFAPESQRERVLLAAAELVPAVPGAPGLAVGAARSGALIPPVVVEISAAGPAVRPLSRISWEDRPPMPAPAADYPAPPPPARDPGARARGRGARRVAGMLAAVGLLAAFGATAIPPGWVPAGVEDVVGGDRTDRAARALEGGDAAGALRILETLGTDAPARAWLLRAQAHEALADTAAAVAALGTAAARDADDGRWALEAGDRLARLGAVSDAADAYLYAVTPLRSAAELERIARMQERAGHADRARRVRHR